MPHSQLLAEAQVKISISDETLAELKALVDGGAITDYEQAMEWLRPKIKTEVVSA